MLFKTSSSGFGAWDCSGFCLKAVSVASHASIALGSVTPTTSSFVMAAVQVVQLPPAFWGEQAVYGPHYRGGLAPPPDWWAQAAQACALSQYQVAALQQLFQPCRWQTVNGFSYQPVQAQAPMMQMATPLQIPCTPHAWASPYTASLPASTPPSTSGKHPNVGPHELTQEPSATFLGRLVRGSHSTEPA